MKMKCVLTILMAIWNIVAFGQNYKTMVAKADAHYNKNEFAQSVIVYKEAFKIEQKNPGDLYNAACSAALSGDKKLAFKWLNLALKNGWTNVRHLKSDTDLNTLHGSKKWDKMVASMQHEVDKLEANYDKPLQAELLAINEDDQKYRLQINEIEKKYGNKSKEMLDLWKIIQEKDSVNLLKVSAILDKYGWVGPEKVGNQANQTLFLVIQHADLTTQKKYLPMMQEAVKNKKASGSSLALLEDRIALREDKRQTYGSQIGRDATTGKYYVLPLEDPDNVDKRRASVGLGLLADYVKRWEIEWNVDDYKRQLPEIEANEKKNKVSKQ
jgi:hypothetical protein